MFEARLPQEEPDLEVGVDALLDLPEELQDDAVPEHDRAVRLLCPEEIGVERTIRVSQDPPQCRRRPADDRTFGSPEAAALRDPVEQGGAEALVAECVVEHGRVTLPREPGDDRLRDVRE